MACWALLSANIVHALPQFPAELSEGAPGRFLGRFVHVRLPDVYVAINVLSGTLLFLPVPLMAAWFFMDGALGVTSYTIREAEILQLEGARVSWH